MQSLTLNQADLVRVLARVITDTLTIFERQLEQYGKMRTAGDM